MIHPAGALIPLRSKAKVFGFFEQDEKGQHTNENTRFSERLCHISDFNPKFSHFLLFPLPLHLLLLKFPLFPSSQSTSFFLFHSIPSSSILLISLLPL